MHAIYHKRGTKKKKTLRNKKERKKNLTKTLTIAWPDVSFVADQSTEEAAARATRKALTQLPAALTPALLPYGRVFFFRKKNDVTIARPDVSFLRP